MIRAAVTLACVVPTLVIVAPAMADAAPLTIDTRLPPSTSFELDPAELDPIRFTRLAEGASPPPAAQPPSEPRARTELSFSLAPGRFDFSREGAYGLGALFGRPEVAVDNVPVMGEGHALEEPSTVPLNEGLRYSAGVRIEHEDAGIDGTAYVSSSLLGLSYGRLGRLWYGGIDVNIEQFANERPGEAQPDVLSFDVTTGRRLGITGLGADSPLWLLSLRGDFDLLDAEADKSLESQGAWYLNPSLFWSNPAFTFSAQMQVPVDTALAPESAGTQPDYRLRAVFEKRFK